MLILDESDIRGLVDADMARLAIAGAFRALHRGEATLPSVISLPFKDPEGVAHIKAGHLHDDAVWTVKLSADFDPGDGEATRHSGLMLVSSASDGTLVGVLLDNGYLTELRTGAAGAIAADLLARPDVATTAIVGAGSQARFQLEALLKVRPIDNVRVASRSRERAEAFVAEIETRFGLAACLCNSVEDAVRGAGIVITATPATSPVVSAHWLDPGTHVTAVGSDEPTKQELAPEVLARANVIVVDDRSQAARFGELHHAVESGVSTEAEVVTLGELLEGVAQGRASAEDLTVADLTGVGVQDAAIAALVMRRAVARQVEQLDPRSARPARTIVPTAIADLGDR
jgi:ornithine cyclodeaminase/alanine dehydrogenase-like protein (mu-crystallin family)